jgi:hypothetical protein
MTGGFFLNGREIIDPAGNWRGNQIPANAGKLSDSTDVSAITPNRSEVLRWNGTQWVPREDGPGTVNIKDFVDAADLAADDSALPIQRAIDYVYGRGGGIVYIPEGVYKLRSQITIKTGVTLTGCGYGYQQGGTASVALSGTVLNVLWGTGTGSLDDVTKAAIIMNEGSTLTKLAIDYPNQAASTASNPIMYGATIKLFENNPAKFYLSDCKVADLFIKNCYTAVDLRGSRGNRNTANSAYQQIYMTAHRFDNIKMCALRFGFRMDTISDWTFFDRIEQQPGWIDANEFRFNASLRSYVQENFVMFECAGLIDWIKLTTCVAWSIGTVMEFNGASGLPPNNGNASGPVTFVGCEFDGAKRGFYAFGSCLQANIKFIGCTFAMFNTLKLASAQQFGTTAFDPETDSGYVVTIANGTTLEGITITSSYLFGPSRGWIWLAQPTRTVKRIILTGNSTTIDALVVNQNKNDYAINLGTSSTGISYLIAANNILEGCQGTLFGSLNGKLKSLSGDVEINEKGILKELNFVHVKDFGAVGDGTTDDVAAIQAALNSVPSGGKVYITDGRYRITSTNLVIPQNVSLVGSYEFSGGGDSFNAIALSSTKTIQMSEASCLQGCYIFRDGINLLTDDGPRNGGVAPASNTQWLGDAVSMLSGATTNINALTFGNGTFVYVGDGGQLSTSSNNFSRITRTSGVTASINAATFGNGTYVYAASSGALRTSTDGITWTARTSGTTSSINALTFANGTFVYAGAGGVLRTSTDGITWTARTSGTTSSINALTFGNGTYVYAGASGVLRTSTTLSTWTARTSGTTQSINALTFGNGIFVYAGGGGVLRTSTDGITWTERSSGTTQTINALTFGNGVFVYAGNNGVLGTSTDGINWAVRDSRTSENIKALTYADGVYIWGGSAGGLRTSSDAVDWTQRNITSSDVTIKDSLIVGFNRAVFGQFAVRPSILDSVLDCDNGIELVDTIDGEGGRIYNVSLRPVVTDRGQNPPWGWNTRNVGIRIRNGGGIKVTGVSIYGYYRGISIIDSKNVMISGVDISKAPEQWTGTIGIVIERDTGSSAGCEGTSINNCQISRMHTAGIFIADYRTNVIRVSNCSINDFIQFGVLVGGSLDRGCRLLLTHTEFFNQNLVGTGVVVNYDTGEGLISGCIFRKIFTTFSIPAIAPITRTDIQTYAT